MKVDIGFIIKKLISGLLMPFPLALLLLCIGFTLLFYRKKLAVLFQILALSILLISSFQPFANWAIRKLEKPYTPITIDRSNIDKYYDIIVVLGNCHHSDDRLPLHTQFCGTGLYRLTEAVRLWRANPSAQVFVSGYAAGNDTPYAFLARDFVIEQGVDKEKVTAFDTPKDTRQEAEQMAPYLKGTRFALITSASHMGRSEMWFKHYGTNPIPAPAHFFSRQSDQTWEFNTSSLIKTEFAWYQTLGLIWTKLIIALSD